MTHPLVSAAADAQPPVSPKSQPGDSSPRTSTSKASKSLTPSAPAENVHSLAALWARKYYVSVTATNEQSSLNKANNLKEIASKEGRERTVEKLMQNLTLASAQAWSLTESLLSEEIRRHGINPNLINPLEIAADTRFLFQKNPQCLF